MGGTSLYRQRGEANPLGLAMWDYSHMVRRPRGAAGHPMGPIQLAHVGCGRPLPPLGCGPTWDSPFG